MVTYNTCDRCGYTPKYRSDLKAHCNRKFPCKATLSDVTIEEAKERCFPTQPIECENCSKRFASSDTLRKHRVRCKHTNITAPIAHSSTTINNGTINNIVNHVTNNIQIIAHGKENMDHIVNNRAFMLACLNNRTSGMCDLIEVMHFNPNTPQNCNVRKLLKKQPHIDLHDGKKWRTGLSKVALRKIVLGMETLVMEFYDNNEAQGKRVSDVITRRFMEEVGVPLNWDIDDSTDYDCGATYGKNTSEEEAAASNEEIMLVFKKCLYECTQAYPAKVDALAASNAVADSNSNDTFLI